jgi:hypothetical protein
LPAGLFDVELDERPGEPLIFPRRGGVARPQPHHRVADANRLAGLERDVADDAVALVEQTEHRDPLAHWRDPGHRLDRARRVERDRSGAIGRLPGLAAAVAAAKRRRCHRERPQARRGNYSGIHA